MQNNNKLTISPEELTKAGEQIYFSNEDKLKKEHFGEFAVIEVDSQDIIVNPDKLTAIQQARAKHPGKLFYIVQIGNLKPQTSSEVNEVRKYGWAF